MRTLNKIVVILMLLLAMILIPSILIFPEQAEFVLRYAADVIQANLEWLRGLSSAAQVGVRLLLALAGMMVFLIGLLLIILQLFRTRRKTVQLKDKSGELVVDSISEHLSYHLDLLPDVLRVRPSVVSSGKSLRTTIYIETPPDVNVPQKSAEVKETARKVIEDQLGLQTKGEIKVVVRPVSYPKISPTEPKRPTRVDKPIAPPLPPMEPMIEEEEKRAEPLYPEKEELPSFTETYLTPTVDIELGAEGKEEQAATAEDTSSEDDWFALQEPDTSADEDEEEDETALDAKAPPSEPFG
jgi:hypothetical protein